MSMRTDGWTEVCAVGDIDKEDVIRFATDGLCTHEQALLTDGLVVGCQIECPKHNGRFDFTTGEAKRRPARIALKTYPVKVEAGKVFALFGSVLTVSVDRSAR
jgi:3-phenylpropionate/trans-cinnamate dioxygenase ferredoxin component